jgi:hypothetical protein
MESFFHLFCLTNPALMCNNVTFVVHIFNNLSHKKQKLKMVQSMCQYLFVSNPCKHSTLTIFSCQSWTTNVNLSRNSVSTIRWRWPINAYALWLLIAYCFNALKKSCCRINIFHLMYTGGTCEKMKILILGITFFRCILRIIFEIHVKLCVI